MLDGGNGVFLAVGANAALEASPGGVRWSRVSVPFAGEIQSVVFSAKTHTFQIIVFDSAMQTIYGSSDGKKWSVLSLAR